ncbi:MAG: PRC-barrel domain-containing protein [Beijerinckiaceae bacterium]
MKNLMLATVSFALIGGAAIAQQTAPAPVAPANPPAATQPMSPPATTGSTAANRGAMTELNKQMLGTHMWKQAVYDANEARIGEIDNLVIDRNGQISEVVVGVGGFLGLGEKMVSFKYTDLKPMVRNGNLWFVVNMTKEQLTAAPAFDANRYTY